MELGGIRGGLCVWFQWEYELGGHLGNRRLEYTPSPLLYKPALCEGTSAFLSFL